MSSSGFSLVDDSNCSHESKEKLQVGAQDPVQQGAPAAVAMAQDSVQQNTAPAADAMAQDPVQHAAPAAVAMAQDPVQQGATAVTAGQIEASSDGPSDDEAFLLVQDAQGNAVSPDTTRVYEDGTSLSGYAISRARKGYEDVGTWETHANTYGHMHILRRQK